MLFFYLMNLRDNQLSGALPAEISNCARLEALTVRGNQLSGQIPSEIGRLTNLKYLLLHVNQFTGMIPSELGGCTSLIVFEVKTNNLHGEVPASLGNIPSLQWLNFVDNKELCGVLPASILAIRGLTVLLHGTNITTTKISIDVAQFPMYVLPRHKLFELERFCPHEEVGVHVPTANKTDAASKKNMFSKSTWKKEGVLEQLVTQEGDTSTGIGAIPRGAIFHSWVTWSRNELGERTSIHRDEICFISHRWLSKTHPDDSENTKLAHLKSVAKEHPEWKYFWIDYLCIPQQDFSDQSKAINSLPHYVKCCGTMVILCGNSGEAQIDIYRSRGWCRLEQLSSALPLQGRVPFSTGNEQFPAITKLLIANKDTCTLENGNLTFEASDMNPLTGNFVSSDDKIRICDCLKEICDILIQSETVLLSNLGTAILASF